MAPRCSVYVVDPDDEHRRQLIAFNRAKGIEPLSFASVEEFLSEAQRLKPGCVILGKLVAKEAPAVIQAVNASPVIMIAAPASVVTVIKQKKHAASGLLEFPFEHSMVYELLSWLFADLDHDLQLTSEIVAAEKLAHSLSHREGEILRGLVAGLTNKAMAEELGINVRTVEMHRASMMRRLEAHSISEALRIAFYAKIVALPLRDEEPRTVVVVPTAKD